MHTFSILFSSGQCESKGAEGGGCRRKQNDGRPMLVWQKLRQRSVLKPELSSDLTCRAAEDRGQCSDSREGKAALPRGLELQPSQACTGSMRRKKQCCKYGKDMWEDKAGRGNEEEIKRRKRIPQRKAQYFFFNWFITWERVSFSSICPLPSRSFPI